MSVLIILIVALIALVLYLYFHRRREKMTGYIPYIEGLIALLENNGNLAMKKFKEAVTIDSDLVDAYIRLGDLYRKNGDVSRAIQIHQSLTVRPTLKTHEEKKIYFALVQDMLDTNRYNKAISLLKEVLKIDKKDKSAQQLVLRLYEDMENYVDCINLYEEGGIKPKQNKKHAFYYASLAKTKLKNITGDSPGREKEIVNLLKKALKISENSLTALYHLGNYFEEKGDLKKAKEYYNKLITHHPDYAFLIIPKFEKVYFELGSFDKIIPVFEKIFNDNPDNFSVGFALADLYEKKNDIESAAGVYRKLSEKNPKSVLPQLRLLRSMVKDESMEESIGAIEDTMSYKYFKCSKCGFETEEFSFLCPQCHTVESFLPYL
jgi:lipopolysaccharide biosynthesis regulator YciM